MYISSDNTECHNNMQMSQNVPGKYFFSVSLPGLSGGSLTLLVAGWSPWALWRL